MMGAYHLIQTMKGFPMIRTPEEALALVKDLQGKMTLQGSLTKENLRDLDDKVSTIGISTAFTAQALPPGRSYAELEVKAVSFVFDAQEILREMTRNYPSFDTLGEEKINALKDKIQDALKKVPGLPEQNEESNLFTATARRNLLLLPAKKVKNARMTAVGVLCRISGYLDGQAEETLSQDQLKSIKDFADWYAENNGLTQWSHSYQAHVAETAASNALNFISPLLSPVTGTNLDLPQSPEQCKKLSAIVTEVVGKAMSNIFGFPAPSSYKPTGPGMSGP